MSFDRADYDDLVRRGQKERAHDERVALATLSQAAVAAEQLTGDRNWDLYLQLLQGAVEKTQAQREVYWKLLQDPMVVDRDQIMRAKIAAAECQARIDAWTAAIALPGQLMQEGESATERLSTLLSPDDADAA